MVLNVNFSELEIQYLVRNGISDGFITKQHRKSIDFIIDGISLFSQFNTKGQLDLTGCLVDGFQDINNQCIDNILSKSYTLPIYICPECRDLCCGGITVEIERRDQFYTWSKFAWDDCNEKSYYENIGPFYFNKDMYQRFFKQLYNHNFIT